MSKGYVYILRNPALKGMLKIGRTSLTPKRRAENLSGSGLPFPFEVVGHVFAPNASKLESFAHRKFDKYRVSQDREFFYDNELVCIDSIKQQLNLIFTEDEISHARLIRSLEIRQKRAERAELLERFQQVNFRSGRVPFFSSEFLASKESNKGGA